MRRMLAVRRRFSAFGRGSLRFLYPGNRKVLAFLREYEHDGVQDSILCVCNLSRTAQAVELDLSSFAGRVPVDMVGGAVFPPVGQLTYLLTLAPFGFFWFLLAAEAQLPAWHAPAPEPLPEFATVVIRTNIAEVLQPHGRAIIEKEALPAYLPKRRWFAAKGERLIESRLAYAVPLPGAADVLLAEVEAKLPGHSERYVLPLAIAWEDQTTGALSQQLALARIRRGARIGVLTDGFAVDALALGVVAQLRHGAPIRLSDGGEVRFLPTPRMMDLHIPDNPEIRRLSAEQSNSSLILGDAVVLKLVRRVAAGIHPEAEMTRVLTGRGYANSAPLFGEVVRVDADGTPHTLMLAQGFVRNQGDGWTWTLDFLARAVEEIAVTGHEDEAESDAFATYASFAAAMGRRLAELHAALAQPTDDPDFAPETADSATLDAWAVGAVEQLDMALDLLRTPRDWPDHATAEMADSVVAHGSALRRAVRELAARGRDSLRTRVHGDFHLGQVLVVQGDAFIIDFEGEPARPLERRREKSSGLRDVAGLLRSFDYAAAAAAPGRAAASPSTGERRATLLERFRTEAGKRFLEAYRETLKRSPHPWVSPQSEAPLLDLFLLEKAAYEIRYEAANRPAWLAIPLRGLHAIAARLLQAEVVT
jgi:maltose alpha-D-glucosyltransferase/alpha-amylase